MIGANHIGGRVTPEEIGAPEDKRNACFNTLIPKLFNLCKIEHCS